MTLIGYWPLNEDSGDTAYDHSGNENHGTINDGGDNTVPGANGPLGQTAYSFDGSNDYISIGDRKETDGFNSLTISAWILLKSNESTIVGKDKGSGGSRQYKFAVHSGKIRHELYYSNGNSDLYDRGDVQTDVWQLVTLVFTGNRIKGFIQGEKVLDSSAAGSQIRNGSANLEIGRRISNNHDYFDGKISEVRIYNRPLTKSEIQYLYNVGKRGLQTTSKKTS